MAKPLIRLELDMSAIYFARPADWSSRLVVLRQLTYLSRGCVIAPFLACELTFVAIPSEDSRVYLDGVRHCARHPRRYTRKSCNGLAVRGRGHEVLVSHDVLAHSMLIAVPHLDDAWSLMESF